MSEVIANELLHFVFSDFPALQPPILLNSIIVFHDIVLEGNRPIELCKMAKIISRGVDLIRLQIVCPESVQSILSFCKCAATSVSKRYSGSIFLEDHTVEVADDTPFGIVLLPNMYLPIYLTGSLNTVGQSHTSVHAQVKCNSLGVETNASSLLPLFSSQLEAKKLMLQQREALNAKRRSAVPNFTLSGEQPKQTASHEINLPVPFSAALLDHKLEQDKMKEQLHEVSNAIEFESQMQAKRRLRRKRQKEKKNEALQR